MLIALRSIPRYDDRRRTAWGVVTVDRARCDGCNLCVRACPADVLALDGEKVAGMPAPGVGECMACGDCAAICPSGSISLTRTYRFTGTYETLDRGALTPPRL